MSISFTFTTKQNIRVTPFAISNEQHTVSLIAPYVVKLIEVPQQTVPSSISIPGYLEVFTTPTSANQYQVNYASGYITFTMLAAGQTVSVSYNGLGSIVDAADIDTVQNAIVTLGNAAITAGQSAGGGLAGTYPNPVILPAGTNQAVQFNSAGMLAGDATNFSYNPSTHQLELGIGNAYGHLQVTGGGAAIVLQGAIGAENSDIQFYNDSDAAGNYKWDLTYRGATGGGANPDDLVLFRGPGLTQSQIVVDFDYSNGFVGINGVTNITEPLQVHGIIYSDTGGIKYPDGSIQTSAAFATPPGGSNGAVQFNNSGAFGGDTSFFFWDDTNKLLRLTTAGNTGNLYLDTSGSGTPSSLLLAALGTNKWEIGNDVGNSLAQGASALFVYNYSTSHADIFIKPGDDTVYFPYNINVAGSIINSSYTQGSILFAGASGAISQDNSQFFWDDTNHRLGIGTNTPSYPLHIVGSGTPTYQLVLTNGAAGFLFYSDNAGSPSTTELNIISATGNNAEGVLDIQGKDGSGSVVEGQLWAGGGRANLQLGSISNHKLIFVTHNNNVGAFDASGNFGIGTISPAAIFDIETSGGSLRFSNNLANPSTSDLIMVANTGNGALASYDLYGTNPGGSQIRMQAGCGGSIDRCFISAVSLTTRFDLIMASNIIALTALPSGYVGINTTTPDSPLEVVGGSGVTPVAHIVSNVSGGATTLLVENTSTGAYIELKPPSGVYAAGLVFDNGPTDVWQLFNTGNPAITGVANTMAFYNAGSATIPWYIQPTGTFANVVQMLYGTIIGSSNTPFTQGSVLFTGSGGVVSQDNSQFFWDNTNFRLGVGTASPSASLHVINPTGSAAPGLHVQTNTSNPITALFEDTGHACYVYLNSGGGALNAALAFQNAGAFKWLVGNNNNESTNVFSIYRAGGSPGEAISCNFNDNGVGIWNATPAANTFEVGIAALFDNTVSISSLTQGSVLFSGASGLISQNNSNFFWDNTNHRLGLDIAAPIVTLDVTGQGSFRDPSLGTLPNPNGYNGGDIGIVQLFTQAGKAIIATAVNTPHDSPFYYSTGFIIFRQVGPTGSESPLNTGDTIGNLFFGGSTGANTYSAGVQISGIADANWGAGSAPSALTFYTAPSGGQLGNYAFERMRITSGGFVGIGTTSPASVLHINAAAPTITLSAPSAAEGVLSFAGSNIVEGQLWIGNGTGGGNIAFSLVNNAGSARLLTMLSNGRVGLGTSAPGAALHIQSSVGIPLLLQSAVDSDTLDIQFYRASDSIVGGDYRWDLTYRGSTQGDVLQLVRMGGSPLTVQQWDYATGNITIGSTTVTTTSIFDVVSTTEGSRPTPSMTQAQRDGITSPAVGLEVFNTDQDQKNFYNGIAWASQGSYWIHEVVSYSSFTTTSNTRTNTLFMLPAAGHLEEVIIHHTTSFQGGMTISAYTLSVGNIADNARYAGPFDVYQAPGGNVLEDSQTGYLENFNSATTITVTAISTGDTLNDATQGTADIYIKYSVIK
jgi:hypothetical protein